MAVDLKGYIMNSLFLMCVYMCLLETAVTHCVFIAICIICSLKEILSKTLVITSFDEGFLNIVFKQCNELFY